MVDTKNLSDSLPIEILQKDFIITNEEILSHPTLKLTVTQIIF